MINTHEIQRGDLVLFRHGNAPRPLMGVVQYIFNDTELNVEPINSDHFALSVHPSTLIGWWRAGGSIFS